MLVKRLIFDVDGTLIRGVNFIDSNRKTLQDLGLYSDERAEAFLRGIQTYEKQHNSYNAADYVKYLENILGTALPGAFLPTFFKNLRTCTPAKDQTLIDTIRELSKDYELVLLTNYFAESQLGRLNNMGIGQFFSECYGERIIKPNQEAYLEACGDQKPAECVMIGDDIYLDIIRARQEGLSTIFVNSKSAKTNSGIGPVVSSVKDITRQMISSLIG